MKQIRIAQTLLVLLMAIALSGIAYGQTCEGTLSAPTQQVYINAPWNITFFNGDLGSTGYNVTLNLPAAVSLTASTPNPLLVTGIVPDTEYKWEVSTPLAGVYTFNVTVTAPGGSSCTLTVNGTIDVIVPIPDPTLMVFVSNMNTLTLGQAYTEQVTVWNMGPGISYNTMGVASTSGGQAVSPVTWTAGTIGNNSGVDDSHTMQFTITPNACGSDDFTVYVMNYEDGEGNLMAPVYGSDGFTVIGTDIAFTSLTATNVLQGQDTQIDLTVQNIGTLNAAAVSVQIYVDGVLETTRNLGAIAQGASVSDTWTYNTGAKVVGNHNVTAQIVSAVECSSANNQAQAVFVVSSSGGAVCGNGIWEAGEQCDGADLNGQTCVSQGFTGGTLSCAAGTCLFNTSACTSPPAPFCGDGSCNGAESCSTCAADCGTCSTGGSSGGGGGGGGGGGSSRIFYLDLSEEKPEVTLPLRRGDTVKYDWNGKSYSFIIRDVYSDRMRLGVSETLSYKTYEMTNLQTYKLNLDDSPEGDLGVFPKTVGTARTDITWSLLNIGGDKRVIDILPPGSVDRRVVDVGSDEETVPVSSGVYEGVRESLDNYAEGVLEFVETLDVKSKAPVWGGLLLALLIIVLGLGIYFYATREKKEE